MKLIVLGLCLTVLVVCESAIETSDNEIESVIGGAGEGSLLLFTCIHVSQD